MDLLNAYFTSPHISAWQIQVLHPLGGKLPQISMLNSRSYERHRDVPLDPVDSDPWRHQREDFCHKIDQDRWLVILVLARLPQFIETCASDN